MPRWDFAKLRDFYEAHVPTYARGIISRLRAIANEQKVPLYLVGGGARELIRAFIEQIAPDVLENFVFDIDVCAIGDASQLARLAKKELGGMLEVNPTFLTAKLTTPDGYVVDFTTARIEHYEAPGALPAIMPTENIYEDLLRRDFTVNAMAMSLCEDSFGEFIDPSGGAGDLFNREIRVIHPASFLDDPTRLFRAIRYATRLDYKLDENTAALFNQAVEEAYIDFLSPERVRYEFECILNEQMWFGMLWTLANLDVLRAIHPTWSTLPTASGESAEVLELAIRSQDRIITAEFIPPYLIRLNWCLFTVGAEGFRETLRRLGVYQKISFHLEQARLKLDDLLKRMNHHGFNPSRIYRVLIEYPRKTLLFAAFNSLHIRGTEAFRSNVFRYLAEYSPKTNILTGKELAKMGIEEGPLVGKIQEELWWRYIDGQIKGKEDAKKIIPEIVAKYT